MKIYVDESHGWARYGKHRAISSTALLERTGQRYADAGSAATPLWIFDIDSTLMCLSARFQHIFFDYLRFHHPGPVSPAIWAAAHRLSPEEHRYGIFESLYPAFSQCGIEGAETLARQFEERMLPFWLDAFFSDRYLDKDFAYPGAAAFVSAVRAMGVHVCYLTGRPAKNMTQGTRLSLRQLGFPLDDQSSFLVLKTNEEESDVEYKHRYLRQLNRRYRVLGFVDNEPENVRAQIQINRDAASVWFHSISSNRIPELTPFESEHLCVLRSFNNQ